MINTILPLFCVVFIGYVFAKAQQITKQGLRDMTRYILYIAVPLHLVYGLSQKPLPEYQDFGLLLAYFSASSITYVR